MIRRLGRYRLVRWPVRLGVIYLFLAVIPVMPWRPDTNCPRETAVGELSELYADEISQSFDVNHVYYWRLGNMIFLRILSTGDGTENWSRFDVINNTEWKTAQDIIDGRARQGYDGPFHPIPEAVRRAQALPETDPDDPGFDRVCAVFAAAVLEDRRWPF